MVLLVLNCGFTSWPTFFYLNVVLCEQESLNEHLFLVVSRCLFTIVFMEKVMTLLLLSLACFKFSYAKQKRHQFEEHIASYRFNL